LITHSIHAQPTAIAATAPNIVADTICATADLGLSIDHAADAYEVTHPYCRPSTMDSTCSSGEHSYRVRDHAEHSLADLPIAGHPSLLHVLVLRLI
jgi:transposase